MDIVDHAAPGEVVMRWLVAVRKFLGKLTDVLTWGRARGLWSKDQGINRQDPPQFNEPSKPGKGWK